MNFKLIGFGVFILAIALASIFGYLYFTERTDHANDNQLNTQKYNGLQDQMNQTADSLKILAVQIGDLNTQKDKEANRKGYWMAIAEKYQGVLDSVFKSGEGNATAGEDSEGKYFKSTFGGKENFVSYLGETKYYPLPLPRSTYNIKLGFDTLNISSELYRDTDKLWKIKVESKTPGVRLKNYYTIDSTVFNSLISGTSLPIPDPATDWGVLGQLAVSRIIPNTVDGAVGGYYGVVSAKYFVKEKSFWVDVTGKFSLRSWKFGW